MTKYKALTLKYVGSCITHTHTHISTRESLSCHDLYKVQFTVKRKKKYIKFGDGTKSSASVVKGEVSYSFQIKFSWQNNGQADSLCQSRANMLPT